MIATFVLAVAVPLAPARAASPAALPPAGPGVAEIEDVTIDTTDRQELAATFYVPRDPDRIAPGVLLIHDAGGDRSQLASLAERLQRNGFGVLNLDLRAHGDSESGPKKWDAMSETERETTWTFAARDIEAASRWLSRQATVHTTNISLVGFRSGSALAVRQAARDQNVMSVVLVAPAAQQYGFDLESEISDLEGLPTCILAQRDEAQVAEALSARGNSLGDPYIEVIKTSSKTDEIDRRTANDIADWLRAQAMLKR